jgi:hypothetical protein
MLSIQMIHLGTLHLATERPSKGRERLHGRSCSCLWMQDMRTASETPIRLLLVTLTHLLFHGRESTLS